jgi:hypothetical protein
LLFGGIPGQDLPTLPAKNRDFSIRPDLLPLFIVTVREPIDGYVFIIRVQEVHKRSMASQGSDRADQHEDALDDKQGRCSLHERLLLTPRTTDLISERWIYIRETEAVACDLSPKA